MLSVERLRKIDPNLKDLSEEEINKIKDNYYDLGAIMFEKWQLDHGGSKNPVGEFQLVVLKHKISKI